jgi:hypothetical protein
MKLKEPLRRKAVKAKLASQPSAVKLDTVDNLAKSYFSLRDQVESMVAQMERTKEQIKSYAESEGVPDGKSKLLFSRHYVIGYSESTPGPEIDPAKLRTKVTTFVWNQLTTLVVDPEKVMALVDSGNLSKDVFLKCLKKSDRKPTRRVYVETLAQHQIKKEKFSHDTEQAD